MSLVQTTILLVLLTSLVVVDECFQLLRVLADVDPDQLGMLVGIFLAVLEPKLVLVVVLEQPSHFRLDGDEMMFVSLLLIA